MDINKTAEYITQKRKEKNFTQRQLAQILNISDKTVSKWETAKGMPDVAIIGELCSALDITPTEFFMGADAAERDKKEDIIIDVAQRYREKGKKQTICYYQFVFSVFFVSVASFFGDGFAKLTMLASIYATSAIAAYKLGKISTADLKKLQKFALLILVIMILATVDLGFNYFNALNTAENDGIVITGYMARLLLGDYGWSLKKFLILFKNSASATGLVAGQNLFLLSSRIKNR